MRAQQKNPNNPNNDFEVPQVQPDGITSISFSRTSDNFFVASSWNNEVRFWQAMSSGQSVPKTMIASPEAVLCTSWGTDNSAVFFGGCDKTVQMWAPQTGQKQQVGVHDAPVKAVSFVGDMNMLCSASWDRSLRWWDVRAPSGQPKGSVSLVEPCYSMDVVFPIMAVATAKKRIVIFDLRKPQQAYKTLDTTLREQTRTVACFPDKTGFACGSIEGRVSIQYVEDNKRRDNFAFRCHRTALEVFPVNSISFHPVHGTFATCGGDGGISFWDKDAKHRLKQFEPMSMPITASAYNSNGGIFAYAASYDWAKGMQFYNKDEKPQIFLHAVADDEAKPKKKTANRR